MSTEAKLEFSLKSIRPGQLVHFKSYWGEKKISIFQERIIFHSLLNATFYLGHHLGNRRQVRHSERHFEFDPKIDTLRPIRFGWEITRHIKPSCAVLDSLYQKTQLASS